VPLCLYSTSVHVDCMPALFFPVACAVPPSIGQLAVFGKAESAKAKGIASIAAATEISSKRKTFFSIHSPISDRDILRLSRCSEVSDTEMIVRMAPKGHSIECGDCVKLSAFAKVNTK
jgi:hypothetical protein